MKVKVINSEILKQGKVEESIIVKSFDEYKKLGGDMDEFQAYFKTLDRAKYFESLYISGMDMSLSGIPVNEEALRIKRLYAQVFWTIRHLWFGKPLRKVSFADFDLAEFNSIL